MRVKTLGKKLVKYANLLDPIIREELKMGNNYRLKGKNITVQMEPNPRYPIALATSYQANRLIVLYPNAIIKEIDKLYPVTKDRYKRYLNINITRKQFTRTLLINILIHEMLHMYQYIPARFTFRISSSRYRFTSAVYQIEHSVQLKVCHIFMKYHKFLQEQFGILPYGVTLTATFSFALRTLIPEKSMEDIYADCVMEWNSYVDMVIPVLKKWKVAVSGYYLERNTKFRRASIDHLEAVYNGSNDTNDEIQMLSKLSKNDDKPIYISDVNKLAISKYYEYRKKYAAGHK